MTLGFSVCSTRRVETIHITEEATRLLPERGSGLLFLFVPHTTCGLYVNEAWDPDVVTDTQEYLSRLIPPDPHFHHSEGNSDSHIKAILTGQQTFLFFEEGKLLLGRWGGLFFAEFDGPRERQVLAKTFLSA